VAITGTNGKTSCSHFIAGALSSLGLKCGVIGTLGHGVLEDLNESFMTTPDAIDLQGYLAYLVGETCQAVALEASSHGLEQGRLNGTLVDTAVFTNITRDHLDYHETFEGYQDAKKLLFSWEGLKTAIINIDDDFGIVLSSSVSKNVTVYTTSTHNPEADVYCRNICLDKNGMSFELISPWGTATIKSRLMGEFNVSNLVATAALLGSRGYSMKDIVSALSNAEAVKGRMEVIRDGNQSTVVIDYAHTPDALQKALLATQQHCKGDLWCVFGCGGDRDKGKRPEMGEIASRLAAHTMITDDNPRSESSASIAGDIFKGVIPGSDVNIETNRRLAIRKVLKCAGPGDVVLIAGKGHEQYQEIMGEKFAFSDHEVVREFVGKSE
jgi:UDP-N-acetylmuramoyl-L-alanyl-D-glutamate--2,6-diaminopimelate ligase